MSENLNIKEYNNFANIEENIISQSDVVELRSISKYAKICAICYILSLLIIPIIIGLIFGLIAGIKCLTSISNKKIRDNLKTSGILMIVFSCFLLLGAIIVGFILSSQIKKMYGWTEFIKKENK